MSQGLRYHPKETDLLEARQVFREHESRDLFYQAARELIRFAIAGQTTLSVAEALGTLLQTWNKSFYRFHRTFDEIHFRALEKVVEDTSDKWKAWRLRSIESLVPDEMQDMRDIFAAFELVLGPVGAAKALHLLSPTFFPLWDRKIASGYGVAIRRIGQNATRYVRFVEITRDQVSALNTSQLPKEEVLKLIDEYNYSLITKGWIPRAEIP